MTLCLGLYKLYHIMQPRKLRHWISRSEAELGKVCATIMLYVVHLVIANMFEFVRIAGGVQLV
jgi:hypothetical protein